MAPRIKAFSSYGPKIDLGKPAEPHRFLEMITQRTTLSSGVVRNVQESEVETLIGFLREGRAVHTGVAIFTPSIDLEGNISVKVRVDKRIHSALNAPDAFAGTINNRENIGKSSDELVALWNEANPQDQVAS